MTRADRTDAVQWRALRAMLDASDVDDLVPDEPMRVHPSDRGVYVQSRSRGSVRIGTYPTWETIEHDAAVLTDHQFREYQLEHRLPATEIAFESVRHHVDDLDAKRRRPLEEKARKSEAKIKRAVDLHEQGHSPRRIAQIMTAEGLIRGDKDPARSVRRWLAGEKSRTDRERSDSP